MTGSIIVFWLLLGPPLWFALFVLLGVRAQTREERRRWKRIQQRRANEARHRAERFE